MFKIYLRDQPPQEVQADELAAIEALERLGVKGIDRVVAVKVNGEKKDLSIVLGFYSGIEKQTYYLSDSLNPFP